MKNELVERISPTLRVGDTFVNKYNQTEVVLDIIGNNYIAESAESYKKKWLEKVDNYEYIIHTDHGDLIIYKEDDNWSSSLVFTSDDEDSGALETLKSIRNTLGLLIELKETDERIELQFNGDRGGEVYDIDIPDEVMRELIEKYA
jgi:hypothetical protein